MNPTSLLTGLGAAVSAEPTLGANGTGPASATGTADLFMALVAGMLDGQGTGTPGAPAAPAGDAAPADGLPVATDATTETEQPTPELVDVQPDAADLATVPVAVPVIVQPALLAQALPAAAPSAGEPVAAASPATTAPTVAAPAPVDVPASAPATGADSQETTGQDAGHDPGTPAGTPAPASAPAPSTPATPAAGSSPAPTSVTAVGAAAPTAPLAPVDTAAAPATHRVTEQVFPEVVRISTATVDGGPRRVTVKLNPESLGEVRVVLTSRRGELEVSLAAGQDARRALVEGAPELHRLLESVGRADSRIVFRDLPGAAPVPPISQDGSVRTDVSTDLSGDAWSGAGRPGGEPAAERDGARPRAGSTTATDGTTSATPASRPVTTAGRSHSGVDLTM